MSSEYARKVSDALIEQLQRGVAPWQKPWKPGERHLPYNPTTENDYRGINSMWLTAQGYEDPRWLTYKQAAAIGAQVRKGEKGTVVEYWKLHGTEAVRDADGNTVKDENGKIKQQRVEYTRPRVFHAVVFNAQQIDGLPERTPRELAPETERHALAEAILRNSGAKIHHSNGDRAFYRPSRDEITLPLFEQFQEPSGYYATALHELGHWTGHESRLNRDLSNPFGSEGYAKEELRAEIASLMMGDRIGIGHDPERHASYVGSWIKALKEDPREIFRAAADAEKITGYVMGLHQEQVQFTEQDRKGTLQELVDLRAAATVAARDAIEAIAEAGRDEGMTDEEMREAKAVAASWRDEAQATLTNAVKDASGEVRDEWSTLNALEEQARNASAQLSSAAFTLELARLSPQEQEERQASYSGSIEDALASGREAHDEYVRAYAAIDDFIAESGLKMPADYGASNVYTNDAVRVALQAAHDQAVPSYSPLESWENIEGVAREQGAKAAIELRVGDSDEAPYQVRFTDEATGALLPITASIHRDGKALVSVNGERAGGVWSEDHETQRFDLEATFAQVRNQQKIDQLASGVAAVYTEFKEGRAASDSPNPAAAFEAAMHGTVVATPKEAQAVASAFLLDSQRIAREEGITSKEASFLGATLKSYGDAQASDVWRGLSDEDRKAAMTAAVEGRDHGLGADAPQHFATVAQHRESYPIGAPRDPVLMSAPEASMQNNAERVYLAVPYREKDAAKQAANQAGFKLSWDKDAKAWYAPADADLNAVSKWRLESATIAAPGPKVDPQDEFAEALRSHGFVLDGKPVMNGQLQRAAVEGDTGNEQSGAYVGYTDGHPAGFIQNHRKGVKENWKSEAPAENIDPALRARLNAEAEEKRRARAEERAAKHEHGAGVAKAVYATAAAASSEHAYCQAKGITDDAGIGALRQVSGSIDGAHVAENFREAKSLREANPGDAVFVKGDLLVPAHDFDGQLWSLQSINTSHKSFMSGGRKGGLHTMVGTDKTFAESGLAEGNAPLILVEGYATGDTVSRALGHPVIAAFDSGNLLAVARDLRERFPDREIVIAGDNDHMKEGKLGPDGKPAINVGRVKAEEAAAAVGGVALIPTFAPGDAGSDWKDVEQSEGVGIEGVRTRLRAGLSHARERSQEQAQALTRSRSAPTPSQAEEQPRKKARGVSR